MDPHDPEQRWLYGFSVSGVGGIPADRPVRIGPLARMNFLVGRNNHGKSTILRAAQNWTDVRSGEALPGAWETLVPVERRAVDEHLRAWNVSTLHERELRLARLVALSDERVGVWVSRERSSNNSAAIEPNAATEALRTQLVEHTYGGGSFLTTYPHVAEKSVLIPAFRELRHFGHNAGTPNIAAGEGIVEELSRWERPRSPGTQEYRRGKARWRQLQLFVRDVLEDPQADLEVAEGTDLHVRLAQAGRMLHINDLGDGIKQVLMIAAACIYYDNSLVLLEEPEIHLHAGLQRKLVRFLVSNTKSQYIIATHSAHILDLPTAHIFHVTHDGQSSSVTTAVRAAEVHKVCQELGYMASDLLQANYTIWVEGPSDRIYWRAWLKLVEPSLEEGVHFAIMTYGGYLVDGLHIQDESGANPDDLIALLRLGRNCTLIADSDKKTSRSRLRPTIQRLMEEAKEPGSGEVLVCTWVSTVENLLPRNLFREEVIQLHKRAGHRLKSVETHTPFDDPFHGMGKSTYSKVRVAEGVALQLTREHMGRSLVAKVEDLAHRIKVANGLSARPDTKD